MFAASTSDSTSAKGCGLTIPLLTTTLASPASWARPAQSRTNSKPTNGSLYVKARPTLSCTLLARSTSASGVTSRHATSASPAHAREAFWQKGQARLQP